MARGKVPGERDESAPDGFLLTGLLEVAVPMWMDQLWPLPWAEKMKRRDACLAAMGITDDGDLLNGVAHMVTATQAKKPGLVANAFNRMAEGLALMALQPGGVKFMGLHWERQPHHWPAPDKDRPLSLRSMLLRCPTCLRPEAWSTTESHIQTKTPAGDATKVATSRRPARPRISRGAPSSRGTEAGTGGRGSE